MYKPPQSRIYSVYSERVDFLLLMLHFGHEKWSLGSKLDICGV